MKSYGVTTQMKPRQLYFHMVLFIAMFLYKMKFEICLEFLISGTIGSEMVRGDCFHNLWCHFNFFSR